MLGRVLLAASRSSRIRRLITVAPAGRAAVARFVAGESPDDAVRTARALANDGLLVTLDHVGEDTLDHVRAVGNRDAYLIVLMRLDRTGLSANADVSVKLSAVGQALPGDGPKIALDHAWSICQAARDVGVTVTLDMEGHTTTDATLRALRELRREFPSVGVALQACLRRTGSDCRDLAYAGSRVRLCKGAYAEPATVAYRRKADVQDAYIRNMDVLMAGKAHAMVATHDPRLITAAASLARRHDRDPATYEFQMLFGVRPHEQRRLRDAGRRVRIYLPYGTDWYGYFMRRLAERPANTRVLLRSLATRS